MVRHSASPPLNDPTLHSGQSVCRRRSSTTEGPRVQQLNIVRRSTPGVEVKDGYDGLG